MASIWLMSVLLGMLFFCQGEAAINLLGEDITQPLIIWDMDGIKKLLKADSKAWKECEANTKDVSHMRSEWGELIRCSGKLSRDGRIDPDNVDMDEVCNRTDDYTKCVQRNLELFIDFCGLTGDVKKTLEAAGKMHNKMCQTMCEKDHKLYNEFEEKGKECVESKKTELKKCSTDNSKDGMEYGKKDCIKAWDFVECVEDTLEDCEEHASDAVVKIMSKGLMATDCKAQNPNGGTWTVAPMAFLTLSVSFISLIFLF